jgi:hypothetical protein
MKDVQPGCAGGTWLALRERRNGGVITGLNIVIGDEGDCQGFFPGTFGGSGPRGMSGAMAIAAAEQRARRLRA